MIFTDQNKHLFSIKRNYPSSASPQLKNREYVSLARKIKEPDISYFSYSIIKDLQGRKNGCNSCNGAK